jgi:hypothetical protein
MKAPLYEAVQVYKHVSNLFTERDKAVYRAKVGLVSYLVLIKLINRITATTSLAWVLNQLPQRFGTTHAIMHERIRKISR